MSEVSQIKFEPFSLPTDCTLVKANMGSKNTSYLAEFEGILSTHHKDLVEEEVFIKGMDISFLNSGYGQLNWWHQGRQNPALIVGLFDHAEKIENDTKVYFKAHLFKGIKAAQDCYDLAKALEAEGKTMGISVEGGVTYKADKKIYKSTANGGALTTQPINPNCFANLMKSFGGYAPAGGQDPYIEELAKAMTVSGNNIYGLAPYMAPHQEGDVALKPSKTKKSDEDLTLEEAVIFMKAQFPNLSEQSLRNFLINKYKQFQ